MTRLGNCLIGYALVAISLATPASAAMLRYEAFDYAPGSVQGTTTPGGGTWLRAGVANPPTAINVVSNSLTVPPEISAPIGNSAAITGAGGASGSTNRLNLGSTVTAGTVYFSFALKVEALTSSNNGVGGWFLGLNNSTGTQTTNPGVAVARMQGRIDPNDATKYQVGIVNTDATAAVLNGQSLPSLNVNQTYFMVGAYTFNPGLNDDVASLWINPGNLDLSTPPAPTVTITGPDVTGGQIASILLRQSPAPFLRVDELRVGTDWDSVTAPEPGTLWLVAVGCMAWCGARGRRVSR